MIRLKLPHRNVDKDEREEKELFMHYLGESLRKQQFESSYEERSIDKRDQSHRNYRETR